MSDRLSTAWNFWQLRDFLS